MESELSTRYEYCEILETKVETLKREKRDGEREWHKKLDDRDRLISELKSQLLAGGSPLTKIDTRLPSSSASSSPVSAASYLRSFNPFGK